METEAKKEGDSYSVIFLGPTNEVGGKNTGLGRTEKEAIEAGGVEDVFYGVSRHSTKDKFIKGANQVEVSRYAVIRGYFPEGACFVDDKGRIVVGEESWRPSDVDKLVKKGILVICQKLKHSE
jgi:hypothetical protein